MANHKRNVEGLLTHAKQKSHIAMKNVDRAIQKLIKEKEPINFSRVAELASVSKTFLYKHQEIKDRIIQLRKQQYEVFSPKSVKRNMNNENKDAFIEVQRNKIKNLEKEIEKLKKELNQYRVKIYDSI